MSQAMTSEFTDFAKITQVELKQLQYNIRRIIPGSELTFRAYRSDIIRSMVAELCSYIYSLKTGEKTVSHSYPANWLEAVKERWAPRWVLSRWPVRMATWTYTFESIAILPELKIALDGHAGRSLMVAYRTDCAESRGESFAT